MLKALESEVRIAAIQALREGGPVAAIEAELAAVTHDPERAVRLEVARALLRVNGPADRTAGAILIGLAADREPVGDRADALAALRQASEQSQGRAIEAMVELLKRAGPVVRLDVVSCLNGAGPRAGIAVPALELLLEDAEPDVRTAALQAIFSIEEGTNHRLIPAMVNLIGDPSMAQDWRTDLLNRVKEADPAALARATPALIRQLGDTSASVRRAAMELLSNILEDQAALMPSERDRR
jgi:HEAT repeat protein